MPGLELVTLKPNVTLVCLLLALYPPSGSEIFHHPLGHNAQRLA